MDKLQFSKVRDVKSPQRAHPTDAGIDFFIPNDFKRFGLLPHQRILIPSGIHVKIPEGCALIAFNKSGVSSKKGFDILACVVDEPYQGEVHISILNTSDTDGQVLEPGMKIAQFILLPVNYAQTEEVPFKELYKEESDRGASGFGDSGE